MKINLLTDPSGDELRSLHAWLVEEEELHGRVLFAGEPPEPGRMGTAVEALLVTLAPGGALTVLSGVLITWLRHRTSDVTLTALRDGDRVQVTLSAKRMRSLDGADLPRQIAEVERLLGGESDAGQPGAIDQ